MYRQSKLVWLVAALAMLVGVTAGVGMLVGRRSGRPAVATVVVVSMLTVGGFGVAKLIGF